VRARMLNAEMQGTAVVGTSLALPASLDELGGDSTFFGMDMSAGKHFVCVCVCVCACVRRVGAKQTLA